MNHERITIVFNGWKCTEYGMALIQSFSEYLLKHSSHGQMIVSPKVQLSDDDIEIGWTLVVEPDLSIYESETLHDQINGDLITLDNELRSEHGLPCYMMV